MLKSKIYSILFLAFCTLTAFAQNKDAVIGKWLSATGDGQVEIYKRGDKYFGKLSWLKEPNNELGKPKADIKNPNVNMHTKPLLGLEILKDFVFEDGKWTDGTIYDPKTGKTYSSNLSIKENGHLSIRGYIGISLIGRTEIWKRVK